MDPDFRGEVADFYHKYRRGYPPAVIDMVMDAFGLTGDDIVVDLGCGTGQLALPIAGRVRGGRRRPRARHADTRPAGRG